LEQFVIPGPDLKAPLLWLNPGLFYRLHLVFYTFPGEGAGSFGVGMTGIAVDFKVVQPYPLYPLPLDKGKGKGLYKRGFAPL